MVIIRYRTGLWFKIGRPLYVRAVQARGSGRGSSAFSRSFPDFTPGLPDFILRGMENSAAYDLEDSDDSDDLGLGAMVPVKLRLHRESNVNFPLYQFMRFKHLDLEEHPRVRLVAVHSTVPATDRMSRDLPPGTRLTVYRFWYRSRSLIAEITSPSLFAHSPPPNIPPEARGFVRRLRRRGAQIDQEFWVTDIDLNDREPGSDMPPSEYCRRVRRPVNMASYVTHRPAHDRISKLRRSGTG